MGARTLRPGRFPGRARHLLAGRSDPELGLDRWEGYLREGLAAMRAREELQADVEIEALVTATISAFQADWR